MYTTRMCVSVCVELTALRMAGWSGQRLARTVEGFAWDSRVQYELLVPAVLMCLQGPWVEREMTP